jgi:uncharacterized repeat protein (TIGR01451 family)
MSRVRAVATTFLTLATVLLSHPSASAKPHPKPKPSVSTVAAPQLNIAITDGRIAAARGDRLTYTIRVQNLGTTTAQNLHISQTLPPGLSLVSADHHGTASAGRVSWIVNLKPGEESTVATIGHVGPTPADLLRLASVVCATAKGGRKPLVCATHSDLLPTATGTRVDQSTSDRIWYGMAGGAVLVAGLVAFILRRRRKPVRIES